MPLADWLKAGHMTCNKSPYCTARAVLAVQYELDELDSDEVRAPAQSIQGLFLSRLPVYWPGALTMRIECIASVNG